MQNVAKQLADRFEKYASVYSSTPHGPADRLMWNLTAPRRIDGGHPSPLISAQIGASNTALNFVPAVKPSNARNLVR